jgi:hypothetical protein
MISALLFIDSTGEVVIRRSYRGDENVNVPLELLCHPEHAPLVLRDGVSYMHIRVKGIFIVAASVSNSSACESLLVRVELDTCNAATASSSSSSSTAWR